MRAWQMDFRKLREALGVWGQKVEGVRDGKVQILQKERDPLGSLG